MGGQACVFYGAAQVSKDVDLVRSKKTVLNRDWPVIELLVNIHIHENLAAAQPDWIRFWLSECRTPVQLMALARRFAAECRALAGARPLLAHALAGNEAALVPALDAEMRAEQAVDKPYWEPVRRELEAMRLDEARRKRSSK
jgi:CelD/BcsL family acetyltransferase involved in cellulose biosynthesis